MATNINQVGQFKTDKAAFQAQATADGLNLQAVRQQAISGLPGTATEQQKKAAVQAAIQQAIQKANDPTLTQKYNTVQQDKTQMKAHGCHGGKHKGGAAGQDQTVQSVINEGSSASVSDISSVLSSLSPSDPNYSALQSMLVVAQAKAQQQPNGASGSNLNFMS